MDIETTKVIQVEYYPNRKLCPNNLETSKVSVHEYLVRKHGSQGRVIMTKRYHMKPLPAIPDILNSTPQEERSSLEYIVCLDKYNHETKVANKYNSESLYQRSLVFADMHSCIKQSARDRMMSDDRYLMLVSNEWHYGHW